MIRRAIGAVVGLIYAVAYGFLTGLMTGGGHGNFLWLTAFLVTFFFGIFFPVAGFLVVDLKKLWARVALTVLLFLNLFTTIYFLFGFLTGNAWLDAAKSWDRSPATVIVMSTIHLIPVIGLWVLVLRELSKRDSISGEYK